MQVIVPRVSGAVAQHRSVACWMRRSARSGWPASGEDRAERFDLAAAPLLRFALIRLAADPHRLVLTNHHMLMDGWSMPVLVRELLALYAGRAGCAALPRVTPYRDYLALARRAGPRGALRPGGRRWPGWRRPPGRRRSGARGGAPEQITLSLRAERGAERAGARGRGDAEHVLQAAWAFCWAV